MSGARCEEKDVMLQGMRGCKVQGVQGARGAGYKYSSVQGVSDPFWCRVSSAILHLVTAKMGGIPRRGPTTRLAALDAGQIPNRKGTSRCV